MWLSGSYEVWIISKNDKSLTLGRGLAGKASFVSSASCVQILNQTCYLMVEGEQGDKKYTQSQGVDISSEEKLIATCHLKNTFYREMNVTPKFETHLRSTFGEKVAESSGQSISLGSNESKIVSFSLPKANIPQAYDVTMELIDENGALASNQAVFHYVLRGVSGTIQNIRLDKESYLKGDQAKVSFFWTGSADGFPQARANGSQLDSARIEISVKDGSGRLCAPLLEREADASKNQIIDFQVMMESDCSTPVVSAVIKDGSGNTLDRSGFSLVKEEALQIEKGEKEQETSFLRIAEIVALIVFIFVLILIVIKNFGRESKVKILSIALLVGVGMFVGSLNVQAETYYASGTAYNLSLNNNIFAPGEEIIGYASIGEWAYCANGAFWAQTKASIPLANPPVAETDIIRNACASIRVLSHWVESCGGCSGACGFFPSYGHTYCCNGTVSGAAANCSTGWFIPYVPVFVNACEDGSGHSGGSGSISGIASDSSGYVQFRYAGYNVSWDWQTTNLDYTVVDTNPTLTLTATPSTIGYGTGVTTSNLSWTSNSKVIDNTCVATSSPADSSWNGSGKPKSSNQNVSPTQTTGYTLTCNTTDPAQPTITSPTVTVTYVSEPCVPDLTPICYNPTPVCGDTICGPVTGVARCVPTKGCGVASVPCGSLTCDPNTVSCSCPNKDWIEVAP